MQQDLAPEQLLMTLKKGQLAPFYLFYGPSEFRSEFVVRKILNVVMSGETRDFNLHIFQGDKTDPGDILETARSLPFMADKRMLIIRRAELMPASHLESLISFLENPVDSTLALFLSVKPNFSKKFFKKFRAMNRAVHFKRLEDRQVVPWIKRAARELGLTMDGPACAYLQQIVGNRAGELHRELEKLRLRHGDGKIGMEEVKVLAIHSRIYTIFELMDEISFKRRQAAMSLLNRFLEEEGGESVLRIIGMLNRQVLLLWQAKSVLEAGGRASDVARKIRLPVPLAGKMIKQSKAWKEQELEKAIHLLYEADGLLKSGSPDRLILENLVSALCA